MRYRLTLRLVLLGAIYPTLSGPAICAQLPRRLESCLPYPTLAQEIRQMQEETSVVTSAPEQTSHPKVTIDAVIFQDAIDLPEPIRAQITGSLEHASFDSDADWITALREVVAERLREHGYFYAKVSAQAQVLSGDPADQRVSVTVHVDEGRQYRLGEIRFTNANVFPPGQLRDQFPLRDGETLDMQKIRLGIEALTHLYSSQGYIDFTASPDIQVDHAQQRVSLRLEVVEGKQFRVGSVEIFGIDQELADTVLKTKLKPGDPFNSQLIDDFFNENKSVLPADASPQENTQVKRDERNGTVAIMFDVRRCP